MSRPPRPPNPDRAALMRDKNFVWLMAGAIISMLGDQFTLVALPWLVLRMTGDTLVLGTVLGLMSLPRAAFILIGGAVVDRYSPKKVLMVTKYINTALLAALAVLVLAGGLTLWTVYALAFAIGLATAFSIPSATSMLPHVMPPAHLSAANGVMMGLRQLSMFLGPLLAGLLIVLFGDGPSGSATEGAVTDATGLGMAFGFDALSFLLSTWTLAQVRLHSRATANPGAPASASQAVFAAVGAGLRHVWNDRDMRLCFIYWSVVAVLITGPVQIAVPVLATTLNLGAAALGILLGAHGAGTLVGMAVSGAKPGMRLGTLGMTMLVIDVVVGLLFMPMGLIHATWQGAALLGAIGVLGGFMQVSIFTWLQRRTPPALMGRVMGMFMFIFLGLAPLSGAVTGWILRSITLPQLFAGSGGLLVCIALLAMVASPVRQVTDGLHPLAGR
ncbi:MFS transporter [Rhodoferax saidenbachensis]|uniref:MFS family permease n=1 Tax=Rhodoferax saidenbachensis TaxID=1484693 RepID=A0ABU1ZSG7_9BURK|nr:MFS transporter [Rhodoferax saidenbachensis]MDR7308474.1 MFS family permease [Rhodoferax saidenbachensis]